MNSNKRKTFDELVAAAGPAHGLLAWSDMRPHAICGECRAVFRPPAWPEGATIIEATCPDCEHLNVFERDDLFGGASP